MNFDELFEEMWFIETYDQVVAEHPEGIKYVDARAIVIERYVQAVNRGDLPREVRG